MTSRALETRQKLKWQIQRPSGMPMVFRQFSVAQKRGGMMLPLSSSELETRSDGCGGPNGMPFPPGPARLPLGQADRNSDRMFSMRIARIGTWMKGFL
jgi:hypothetical protein